MVASILFHFLMFIIQRIAAMEAMTPKELDCSLSPLNLNSSFSMPFTRPKTE